MMGGGDPGGGGSDAADEDVASYGQDEDLDEVVLESSVRPRLALAAALTTATSSPPPPGSIMWTTMGNTVV